MADQRPGLYAQVGLSVRHKLCAVFIPILLILYLEYLAYCVARSPTSQNFESMDRWQPTMRRCPDKLIWLGYAHAVPRRGANADSAPSLILGT